MSIPFASSLLAATVERALLLLNHVLASEPAARARLAPHVGRTLAVHWDAPAGPWPQPPDVALRITPAARFERIEAAEPGGLRVRVALPAPHALALQWLAGERPQVAVEGDARFAADMAWLADNLRWDAEHDLARLIGDAPAHGLARLGAALQGGLRDAARGLGARRGGGTAGTTGDAAASR